MPSRRKPLKKPQAKIGYLADLDPPSRKTSNGGTEVIERVKKCFARANHENANEQEARAASKMASKIMEQHQITQADIMAEEDSTQRAPRGGMSTVDIWPATDGGRAFTPGWLSWLCGAVEKFFDCRAFSTGYDTKIKWTFYGIAEHTVSAAIAFEAVHNQIQEWSEKYTGISVRNSYCLGVAEGLLILSREHRREAEDKACQTEARALATRIKEEQSKEQERLAKLQPILETEESEDEMDIDDASSIDDPEILRDAPGSASENEDCHDPHEFIPDFDEFQDLTPKVVDTQADFDTELQKFIQPDSSLLNKRPRPKPALQESDSDGDDPSRSPGQEAPIEAAAMAEMAPPDEALNPEETAEWKSMRQLTTFREMSHDIEDDVLKKRGIKLRKGRKKGPEVKDRAAYKEGRKDSKKIEVKAARIEHKVEVMESEESDESDSNMGY